MNKALLGKVAVVMGGSGGIGAATAQLLAAEGARVVVTWRSDEAAAKAVLASLEGTGHLTLPVTIEDSATLAALAEQVRADYGRADILVNSAGFTKPVPMADLDALDDALIDRMFQINWRGQFAAIRAFRPLLLLT